MLKISIQKSVLLAFIALLLPACQTGSPVVTDRSFSAEDFDENGERRAVRPNRPLQVGEYLIKPGDTLYSIAWGAGLNYQDVAKWNNINEPFLIKSGDIITLKKPAGFVEPPVAATIPDEQPIADADIDTPVAVTPSPTPTPPVQSEPAVPVTNGENNVAKAPLRAPSKWLWPIEGPLLTSFSPNQGRSGVQISGQRGAPVNATAAGDVVYVGDGLRGYGNLVIVKHSKEYLSAYAHNDSILVKEGQRVRAGEKIALVGDSGADRTMLHFEIRKDGKPVNPMTYLKK